MEPINDTSTRLRSQIHALESVINDLKLQLAEAEREAKVNGSATQPIAYNGKTYESVIDQNNSTQLDDWKSLSLDASEHIRYGRQLILPEVGLQGQLALKNASVLVVGIGGLGCPAAAYLAGAGVGRIGLIDGDIIELSNLHRQILHRERWIGIKKVDSAAEYLRAMNSELGISVYYHHLTSDTAVDIMKDYDIILDCTDRPATRYLVSDAAVLADKPVVTGSALRTEGQLMVLNAPPTRPHSTSRGHCYRCIYPKPPPTDSVLSCGEGGILGPVVGVIGVLMAMECLKLILPTLKTPSDEYVNSTDTSASLLLYSAYLNPPFRSMKLKGKRKGCLTCSDAASIRKDMFASGSLAYDAFCGVAHPADILSEEERIQPTIYSKVREATGSPHVLVDVREKVQFDICHLKGSINLPYSDISRNPTDSLNRLDDTINSDPSLADSAALYFICRFGNDSQLAVNEFKKLQPLRPHTKYEYVGDIKGGLRAWRQQVDPNFPEY